MDVSTWIVAGAALLQAGAAVVLVVITWRYVRLTKDLVDHHDRADATEAAREEIRRRELEVPLVDEAKALFDTLERRGATYGSGLSEGDKDTLWRRRRRNIETTGLRIGGGVEKAALDVSSRLQAWEEVAERVATDGTPESGRDLKDEAVAAHRHAVDQLSDFIRYLEARKAFREVDAR